jgi:hypothetical protein
MSGMKQAIGLVILIAVCFGAAAAGGAATYPRIEGWYAALTEFNMLGNVATQFEGKLEFDPVACKITNHPEADAALSRPYRQGWSL